MRVFGGPLTHIRLMRNGRAGLELGNDASAEIDLYTGYRGSIDHLHCEAGITYY